MKLERRIREVETRLFARSGVEPDESFVDLASSQVRLRVLSVGAGPSLVMLHGVSLAAAVWAPWLADLSGYRIHLVELPGHGLSGPFTYRIGAVREQTLDLMDDLFDTLALTTAPVVGHSLGGMFALWYAAARPGRIVSLVAIGSPAVALTGVKVRMPLSLMTVPVLGEVVLRNPMPRSVYRRLLGQGLSPAAAAAAPEELLDVLRLAARRKGNARTVASLMHAIDGFRHPRRERHERRRAAPDLGADDVLRGTRRPIHETPRKRCRSSPKSSAGPAQVPGGHGPWPEDPAGCAKVVTTTSRRPDSHRLLSLGGTTPQSAEHLIGGTGAGPQRAFHQAGPVPGGVLAREVHPAQGRGDELVIAVGHVDGGRGVRLTGPPIIVPGGDQGPAGVQGQLGPQRRHPGRPPGRAVGHGQGRQPRLGAAERVHGLDLARRVGRGPGPEASGTLCTADAAAGRVTCSLALCASPARRQASGAVRHRRRERQLPQHGHGHRDDHRVAGHESVAGQHPHTLVIMPTARTGLRDAEAGQALGQPLVALRPPARDGPRGTCWSRP